jgi:hypothetical protein
MPWSHWMVLFKYLEPLDALLEHTLLHVQVPMCNIIMPMEVKKNPKPFSTNFKKLKHWL